MKHTALAAGLLALVGTSAIGCKAPTSLAFWKKGSSDSTALAHSAPALPSDAAKQAGAAGTAAQVAGGQAAPFVSGQTAKTSAPSSYPSTQAPPFSPSSAGQLASSGTPQLSRENSSSNLGSIANPYDPTATPKPPVSASSVAASTVPDRYGAATGPTLSQTANGLATSAYNQAGQTFNQAGQSLAGSPAVKTAGDVINSAPVYGAYPAGSRTAADAAAQASTSVGNALTDNAPRYDAAASSVQTAAATAYPGIAPAATGAQQAGGQAPAYNPGRYGDFAASAATGTTAGAAIGAPVASTNAATSQPYRPGGTSTYPETQIAARPRPTATTTGTTSSVPNVGVPAGILTPGTQSPTQYR